MLPCGWLLQILAAENNLRKLSHLEGLRQLQTLDLSGNLIMNSLAIRPLSLNASLQHLSMRNCPVASLGGYRASIITYLPRLLTLDGDSLPPSQQRHSSQRVEKVGPPLPAAGMGWGRLLALVVLRSTT